ncbi:MAG: 3-phosphoshikimate 1-carboxyvinyltransferase, partial [Acidimicrobiaceae bacterium]|nr:3-phosphoshikimate 1-carboxyvinyltransferase [Acidimicrobiaceae bacterium]
MGQLPPALDIAPLEVPPNATVRLPGSKSITNRALLCAALASGETTLTGALFADDTEAMVEAVRSLGAEVSCAPEEGIMRIRGTTGTVRTTPGTVIDARMSGTTGRFLAPVLALSGRPVTLDGHPQLRVRPFGDLADSLRRLGVRVEFPSGGDGLPMQICGPIRSAEAAVATDRSSQFLSGLMLAGPLVPGGLSFRINRSAVSRPYVEMTAAVMRSFGAAVAVGPEAVHVVGDGYTPVENYAVEPDASAASYFWAAAAITSGTVAVAGLGADSIQGDTRFVSLLRQMGVSTEEVSGCTTVTGGPLRGVEVDLADMSDTAPTLAVAASLASTPTTVRGIGFVRGKESDRIAAVVSELRRCGVEARELADGFSVAGGSSPAGARVRTYDDHRIAMAFAVLGLVVPGMQIENPGCVAKTFP